MFLLPVIKQMDVSSLLMLVDVRLRVVIRQQSFLAMLSLKEGMR